jgi:hypothetical protein
MPVIPVNKVVDPKKNNRKKWRAEEEERHKVSLTQKNHGSVDLEKIGNKKTCIILGQMISSSFYAKIIGAFQIIKGQIRQCVRGGD